MSNPEHLNYPSYEDHRKAWEELAKGIANLKNDVCEEKAQYIPNDNEVKKGQLTIIGTGIESIGVSLGDEKLIRTADKVLYCVADPATVVWLKQIRPDALDLYVLYGEDKVRYVTYMQMTEAQLYWVRQGLNVVVVFYGHPGVFVLSTHRAILLARREGHQAVMKAGVCALDTLCADLGVDPCHPGLQTHEATDCLVRQRHIDPTLHVILWQVGLIGELGYRRQGYLNSGFSIFVNWLSEIYGPDYEITHYIGSRYPTIDPLIEKYCLKELHDINVQSTITGLSTFYLPPRDVVSTKRPVALDLGLIKEEQELVTPQTPLREIGLYGYREMAAFDAYKKFAIPKSYQWQKETEASHFLIELRMDVELQNLYKQDPESALADPRFVNLTDRERHLLLSRDSGAIQIAAKGSYQRSTVNEQFIHTMLTNKEICNNFFELVRSKPVSAVRQDVCSWAESQCKNLDWSSLNQSVDFVYRNYFYPWTGVYSNPEGQHSLVLIGNKNDNKKTTFYFNGKWIRRYRLSNGIIFWNAQEGVPFNGFLKLDLKSSGCRRFVGKIWSPEESSSNVSSIELDELDPDRKLISSKISSCSKEAIYGDYFLRSNGRFSKLPTSMTIAKDSLTINDEPVDSFTIQGNKLTWSGGGARDYDSGKVQFLLDPVIDSIELFGQCSSREEPDITLKCHGAKQIPEDINFNYGGPLVSPGLQKQLVNISHNNLEKGGLMLWYRWEKAHTSNLALGKFLSYTS